MRCPHCSEPETRVIDSRDFGSGVRRRRECTRCHNRFTTQEQLQARNLFVSKKDGRREEFNRDKLLSGIRKACEKRPLPTGTIDKIVDDIEAGIYRLGKPEVASSTIGDMVMQKLKTMDYIAYIRFASVYREFADISTLKAAVDTLVADRTEKPITSQLPLLPDASLSVEHKKEKLLTDTRKATR